MSYGNVGFKTGENELPLSGEEILALAQDAQIPITAEEIAALTVRGPLTPMLMPFILSNKMSMLMMMLANRILMG